MFLEISSHYNWGNFADRKTTVNAQVDYLFR